MASIPRINPDYGTGLLPQQERWLKRPPSWRNSLGRLRRRASVTRAAAASHIQDHGFSWAAMGFIDAACFVHSIFTGLLVTGILLFLFELKIGE
jgi:hypothetical protein